MQRKGTEGMEKEFLDRERAHHLATFKQCTYARISNITFVHPFKQAQY